MARYATKIERGYIFIPPDVFTPSRKVEITKSSGSTETITSNCISIRINKQINIGVSTFDIILDNKEGKYTGMFDYGNEINIWLGYNSSLTKQITAEIERIYYGLSMDGLVISLSGRDYGNQFLRKHASATYENIEASEIITNSTNGLIPKYITGITTNNVEETTTTLTKFTVRNSKISNAIKQVADKVGNVFYVDTSKDLNFFEKGSKVCNTEAAVEGQTIKFMEFGGDRKEVINKIRIYGRNLTGDVPYIKTKENSSSQSLYGVSESIIQDTSLSSDDELDERGDIELADKTTVLNKGNFICLGMPTLEQGRKLRISSPNNNINGFYLPIQITHLYESSGGFTTTLTIEEPSLDLIDFMKNRELENKNAYDINNPNDARDSYVMNFETDNEVSTFGDTEIVDKSLVLVSGYSTGNCVSNIKSLDFTPTKCELRYEGEQLSESKFYVRFRSDAEYQELSLRGEVNIIQPGTGAEIKIKINSSSTNPSPNVNSCAVLMR